MHASWGREVLTLKDAIEAYDIAWPGDERWWEVFLRKLERFTPIKLIVDGIIDWIHLFGGQIFKITFNERDEFINEVVSRALPQYPDIRQRICGIRRRVKPTGTLLLVGCNENGLCLFQFGGFQDASPAAKWFRWYDSSGRVVPAPKP